MAKDTGRKSMLVYADWVGLKNPTLIGTLYYDQFKGKEVFSFEYDPTWIAQDITPDLDPDLKAFTGLQYLDEGKSNFGIFLDSSPDRWGRTLMTRREALTATLEGRTSKTLFETDYLLGVSDAYRMGAIRFKEKENGVFLNNGNEISAPSWTSLRELEQASLHIERDGDSAQALRYINMLIAPGAALGGARPKASVVDEQGHLWIAKFPSINDTHDIGAWEMVAHELAAQSGVAVPESKVGKYSSRQHTFLTKRFDRIGKSGRLHFASAMTVLGYTDGTGSKQGVSYLELAEFIIRNGSSPNADLKQLWTRIVFHICVSNTDDHLRNHGFLLTDSGWKLSPAFDINPVEKGSGLSLNISETDNSLELDLAREVAPYFRVDTKTSEEVIRQVRKAVGKWSTLAEKYGIGKSEREIMAGAFEQAR